MKKKVLKPLFSILVSVVLLSSLNCIPVHAATSVKHLRINPQFTEWNIDEEAVQKGKDGDTAGTVTEYLLVGLAFRWNGTGTPEGAEIGGYTLTGTDGWISKDRTQVQDMEAFAAVLPSIEHYDDCTPFVPDDLLESGLWITGGVRDTKFICALLSDPRIDAQGLLYITEQKNAYVNAEDEDNKQAIIHDDLSFAEISAVLRPLVYAETGDLDGDGMITADDAVLALKGANEITAETEADARTLTPAQEAAGDVDGDGELTAFDAFCILKYFNLREVAEVEDLTWADVLPGA